MKVGYHLASALTTSMLVNVIDVLTAEIRDRNKWKLLFTDDLGMAADTQEEV